MESPIELVLQNLGLSPKAEEIVSLHEPFNWDITSDLLLGLEERFKSLSLPLKVQKKLFKIIAEALDNVCKHSKKSEIYKLSCFSCKIHDGIMFMATRNLISIKEINSLVEMIEDINNSDIEQINSNYRKRLKDGTLDTKGNAGLGFYEMARKSKEPIRFNFSSNDSESAFFTYVIVVDTNQ